MGLGFTTELSGSGEGGGTSQGPREGGGPQDQGRTGIQPLPQPYGTCMEDQETPVPGGGVVEVQEGEHQTTRGTVSRDGQRDAVHAGRNVRAFPGGVPGRRTENRGCGTSVEGRTDPIRSPRGRGRVPRGRWTTVHDAKPNRETTRAHLDHGWGPFQHVHAIPLEWTCPTGTRSRSSWSPPDPSDRPRPSPPPAPCCTTSRLDHARRHNPSHRPPDTGSRRTPTPPSARKDDPPGASREGRERRCDPERGTGTVAPDVRRRHVARGCVRWTCQGRPPMRRPRPRRPPRRPGTPSRSRVAPTIARRPIRETPPRLHSCRKPTARSDRPGPRRPPPLGLGSRPSAWAIPCVWNRRHSKRTRSPSKCPGRSPVCRPNPDPPASVRCTHRRDRRSRRWTDPGAGAT
eukprot:scaffold1141_cov333-Pavlova_lutheri.AAC.26